MIHIAHIDYYSKIFYTIGKYCRGGDRMLGEKPLIETRKWLADGEKASKLYYFKLYTGERGEADSPLSLFDLLVDPAYSDCDDRATHLIMLGKFLKDVAAFHLAPRGIRAVVYDGVGKLFDNSMSRYEDEKEEAHDIEFINMDSPVLLDFWDEYTVLTSLIRCGYLQLFEKVTTFQATYQESSCESCIFYDGEKNRCSAWMAGNTLGRLDKTCPFWTRRAPVGRYLEVTPDSLQSEPMWKVNYKPLTDRHFVYPLYFDQEKLKEIMLMDPQDNEVVEEE